MQDFFLNSDIYKYINLYSLYRDDDEFLLLKLCKTAVDNNVKSISVLESQVENVWKWLELSDVKLNGIINNFNGLLSVEKTFQKIKNIFNSGADMVEVFLPPAFFDIDIENIPAYVDEYLLAIAEAKGIKNVKVSFESSFVKYSSDLKAIVYLLSKYQIDVIKTASGLYSSNSMLNHLNAILEEAKSSNVQVDFLFDLLKNDKFIIDDSIRLAQSILGDEFDNNHFCVSCNVDNFLISLGKSTC